MANMKADPITGNTIQWTFTDGPMAHKSFEHSFHDDGTLEFRMLGDKDDAKATTVNKYEVATVGAGVHAVSYLGPSGYTLTVVMDFHNRRMVAVGSNEKSVTMQRGTFKEMHAPKPMKQAHVAHAR
jgi:hypothetical protein